MRPLAAIPAILAAAALSSCAAPPAVAVIGMLTTGGDAVSLMTDHKTLADQAVSLAADQDCSTILLLESGRFCRPNMTQIAQAVPPGTKYTTADLTPDQATTLAEIPQTPRNQDPRAIALVYEAPANNESIPIELAHDLTSTEKKEPSS